MTKTRIGLSAALCGLIALAWSLGGQAQQTRPKEGNAERIGEKIDDAARALGREAKEVASDLRAAFRRTKTSVENMEVEARVYGRLHWDKALTDAPIELATQANGVVTLSGSVADAAAKAKAVALAQETVGVTRVVDQLTITPAVPSTTTTTTIKAPDGTTTITTEKDVSKNPKP